MPLVMPDLYLTNPQFFIEFHHTRYNVDRILQDKPIASVLAVSKGNKRRIIKIASSLILFRNYI